MENPIEQLGIYKIGSISLKQSQTCCAVKDVKEDYAIHPLSCRSEIENPFQKLYGGTKTYFIQVMTRVRPRFFDQVGHETMYASSVNKHF